MSLKMVDLNDFPTNEEQNNAAEFLQNIQSFDEKKIDKFIDEKFTKRIVEKCQNRN